MAPNTAIALFVYNRLAHTKQVLEALLAADGATNLRLFIYSDGPKAGEEQVVKMVRQLINDFPWPGTKTIVERSSNHGLAKNITGGVSAVLDRFDQIIVLEDDIMLSKGAIRYFQEALRTYRDDEKVMHISAYNWPLKTEMPETFLFRGMSCWGWATWRDAWQYYAPEVEILIDVIEKRGLVDAFNLDGAQSYFDHLLMNQRGELNTWAIRWQASIFIADGLTLMPGQSMVQNIGLDNTGVHSQARHQKRFSHEQLAESVLVEKLPLHESASAYEALRQFFLSPEQRGRKARLVDFLRTLIGK
ncbi:MAG: glycosyltransferase [Bacteroidota bacterium]